MQNIFKFFTMTNKHTMLTLKSLDAKKKTAVTYQSNPVANKVSIAGAMSLAAVMMYFSARVFLGTAYRKSEEQVN